MNNTLIQPYVHVLTKMQDRIFDLGHDVSLQIFPNTIVEDKKSNRSLNNRRVAHVFVLQCHLRFKEQVIYDFRWKMEISDLASGDVEEYALKKLMNVVSSKYFIPNKPTMTDYIKNGKPLQELYNGLRQCVLDKKHKPHAFNGHFLSMVAAVAREKVDCGEVIPNTLRDFLENTWEKEFRDWTYIEEKSFLISIGMNHAPNRIPKFTKRDDTTWVKLPNSEDNMIKRYMFARALIRNSK